MTLIVLNSVDRMNSYELGVSTDISSLVDRVLIRLLARFAEMKLHILPGRLKVDVRLLADLSPSQPLSS